MQRIDPLIGGERLLKSHGMTVQFVGNDRMITTNRPLVSAKTGGRFYSNDSSILKSSLDLFLHI